MINSGWCWERNEASRLHAGRAACAVGRPALGQDEGTSPADAADAVGPAGCEGRSKNETTAPQPDIVASAGSINDIQQLDLQSHSYNVDMYLVKWKNPDIDPARSFAVPGRTPMVTRPR